MLLQTTAGSDALNSTVDQLTESSISLAEAAANFGALKVMFGVFLVFIFLVLIFFLYQMFTYNKKLTDMHESSKKIEKFLEEGNSRSVGTAEANVLVRRTFSDFSQTIKYNILRTRLENHLDRKEVVSTKIYRFVTYEYAEMRSFLSNFVCEDHELSYLIADEDIQVIMDFMLEQVYQEKSVFSISTMDQTTDILINGIKLTALKKL